MKNANHHKAIGYSIMILCLMSLSTSLYAENQSRRIVPGKMQSEWSFRQYAKLGLFYPYSVALGNFSRGQDMLGVGVTIVELSTLPVDDYNEQWLSRVDFGSLNLYVSVYNNIDRNSLLRVSMPLWSSYKRDIRESGIARNIKFLYEAQAVIEVFWAIWFGCGISIDRFNDGLIHGNAIATLGVYFGKSKYDQHPKYFAHSGLTPDLYAEMEFIDDNKDGILTANESAVINIRIHNRGLGEAHKVHVTVEQLIPDPEIKIGNYNIRSLDAGKSVIVTIKVDAGIDVGSGKHTVRIDIKELFGYDMDPAYLVLQTRAFQPPELKFAGLEIIDWGEGTYGRPSDGQLQAGEQARARIVVQNVGKRKAEGIAYKLDSRDDNIYITTGSDSLKSLDPGETADFWITLSPNKRVEATGSLPIYLTLTESTGKGGLTAFQLPLSLNQKPAEPNILAIKPDIDQLKREIARFEYTSPKFTARVSETSSLRPVLPASIKRPNSVAVVIGIEKYRSLPAAPYAESDAELMKEYLAKRLGVEQVVLYKSNEATGLFFDNVFNPYYGELQRAVVKGKTEVFVYYSGHGIPAKDGSAAYLFPSDGRAEQLDKAGYNLNTLYENLNQLGAKSVTVILDACFSGAARPSEKIAVETLVAYKAVGLRITEPWKFYPNFTVINSSALDETSLGYDQSQTGLFTYYLALGLQGKADANGDHKLTLGELKQYVTDNVMETSRKISGLQTPQFHGDENRVLVQW